MGSVEGESGGSETRECAGNRHRTQHRIGAIRPANTHPLRRLARQVRLPAPIQEVELLLDVHTLASRPLVRPQCVVPDGAERREGLHGELGGDGGPLLAAARLLALQHRLGLLDLQLARQQPELARELPYRVVSRRQDQGSDPCCSGRGVGVGKKLLGIERSRERRLQTGGWGKRES